jgi:hypothetical protein
MNIKIEEHASRKIKGLDSLVGKALAVLPAEHLRGFTKLVFVDVITEPRISAAQRSTLPALYHPRMGGEMAWGEIAVSVMLPSAKFHQRLTSRLTLKPSLAQIIFSLAAQHYYFTLAKGVKKNQLEVACRSYTEKYFEKWREAQGGLRMRLTKPLRPYLDKLAKKLSKKYKTEMQKQRAAKK